MISIRRPDAGAVDAYREARLDAAPTYDLADPPASGFRHASYERVLPDGTTLDRAREGIRSWAAHVGSGVAIHPLPADPEPDLTVAFTTRQLGLWILAACRVAAVTDHPDAYGFTYVTLPDHPEQGAESFTVRRGPDGHVTFEIDVTYLPAAPIVKLGGPITRELQRRATIAYLDAMERWVSGASTPRR